MARMFIMASRGAGNRAKTGFDRIRERQVSLGEASELGSWEGEEGEGETLACSFRASAAPSPGC